MYIRCEADGTYKSSVDKFYSADDLAVIAQQCKAEAGDLILIDDCFDQVIFNPNNTILIPEWKGTPYDYALTEWLPDLLEKCFKAKDVRDVISTAPSTIRRASF